MVINLTDLQFTEGTSDKVYLVELHQETISGTSSDYHHYKLICHYGRRGSTLKTVDKGTFYSFHDAHNEYDRVIRQKTSKGYWITGHFNHEPDSPAESPKPVEETVVIESWTSTEDEREKALKRLRESCAVW